MRDWRYSKAIHIGAVFLLTIAVVGLLSVMRIDPHHDGIVLKPAMDVANGKALFRDTFAQYGALATLIQALAIKVFGKYLVVVRLLTALVYGLISALLWLIYSRILPRWLCTFSCIICLSLGYFFFDEPAGAVFASPTVFAVAAALAALYFLILFMESRKYSWLLMTGIFSALTFWFKINYGLISFVFTSLLIVVLNIHSGQRALAKSALAFLSGIFATHAIFVVWLVISGALGDFILQSVKFAFAFSGNTLFSSNDAFAVRLAKNLLQIGSTHGNTSFIWTLVPLAALGILMYSIVKVAAKKTPSPADQTVLAISFICVGLWFGYYPLNALLHMYLSAISSIGLFIWLLWKMTEIKALSPEKNGAKTRAIFVAVMTLLALDYDLCRRESQIIKRISGLADYEMVERPEFLSGMFIPKTEKKVYEEIDDTVKAKPGFALVNITNGGIFSLYRDSAFHKMNMDWEWNNSYLYPDYIPKLQSRIALRSSIILSDDNFIIEGYVPIRVFPKLNKISELTQRTILLIPGEHSNAFEASEAGMDGGYYSIRLRCLSAPVVINSVIAEIFTADDIPRRIARKEFDYNILPRVFDEGSRTFLKGAYSPEDGTDGYSLREPPDDGAARRLVEIFSDIFLYDKFFRTADTFGRSGNEKIEAYLNGSPIGYKGGDSMGVRVSKGDVIGLRIPAGKISGNYTVRLRINFNGNRYAELVFGGPTYAPALKHP
jgi:hypothetical protein